MLSTITSLDAFPYTSLKINNSESPFFHEVIEFDYPEFTSG
jgi:hypothetical protein